MIAYKFAARETIYFDGSYISNSHFCCAIELIDCKFPNPQLYTLVATKTPFNYENKTLLAGLAHVPNMQGIMSNYLGGEHPEYLHLVHVFQDGAKFRDLCLFLLSSHIIGVDRQYYELFSDIGGETECLGPGYPIVSPGKFAIMPYNLPETSLEAIKKPLEAIFSSPVKL